VKFLVDHQLPPVLAAFFREHGHQGQHLAEIGTASCSDAEVYEYADQDSAWQRSISNGPIFCAASNQVIESLRFDDRGGSM
jgi:hypothetical protein